MSNTNEPTDLEIALWERASTTGFGMVGPLTRDQQEAEDAYEAHIERTEREYELEQQHGGKSRCPSCDQFAVKHIHCHNGYDPTTLYRCENCGHEDFAG